MCLGGERSHRGKVPFSHHIKSIYYQYDITVNLDDLAMVVCIRLL